jgi:hypothetical protein
MPLTTLGPLAAALSAQLPKSNPPPPLPAGPFFERLLFEQPFGLATGFALAAVVAFVALNRNGKARTAVLAAGACAALALGSHLLSTMVVTPREQIAAATRALVDATAKADIGALDPMLAPDVRFSSRLSLPGMSIPPSGFDKPTLLTAVSRLFGQAYPLKDHSVKEVQSSIDGPNSGRTQVKVWVQIEGIPNTSWWLVRWRMDADGQWRATTIEPLDIPMFGSPS